MEETHFFNTPNAVSERCVFSRRARAIRFRQDGNEAVGGFFSQIGQLYMVHHLWNIYADS